MLKHQILIIVVIIGIIVARLTVVVVVVVVSPHSSFSSRYEFHKYLPCIDVILNNYIKNEA